MAIDQGPEKQFDLFSCCHSSVYKDTLEKKVADEINSIKDFCATVESLREFNVTRDRSGSKRNHPPA